MKIMNIVMKRIEKKGKHKAENDPMVNKLLEKGFRLEDIDTAFKLISMMTTQVDPILHVGDRDTVAGIPTGVRQLHFSESIRLTPNAHRKLLNMAENQILTPRHFEKVIEYIWKKDLRHVSSERLDLLVLLNKPESELDLNEAEQLLPRSMSIH